MRFMMLVIPKGYEKAGADFAPPADLVAKMTKYNDSLTKAGVLLGLDGLRPYAGARRGRAQPVEPEQDSGLGQGVIVLRHLGDEVCGGREVRPRLLVPLRDHQHHEAHRPQLLQVSGSAPGPSRLQGSVERGSPKSTHLRPPRAACQCAAWTRGYLLHRGGGRDVPAGERVARRWPRRAS